VASGSAEGVVVSTQATAATRIADTSAKIIPICIVDSLTDDLIQCEFEAQLGKWDSGSGFMSIYERIYADAVFQRNGALS
jgi:hypothetical protein